MSSAMAGGDGTAGFHTAATTIPAVAGAYVLLVRLEVPLPPLLPGRYLYCGSAKGPGGLRARLGRHLRKGKALRWHVDRLTEAGVAEGAWVFPGGDECALVAALGHLPMPWPGFGSSDCRVCRSHLLAWPEGEVLPFATGTPVSER